VLFRSRQTQDQAMLCRARVFASVFVPSCRQTSLSQTVCVAHLTKKSNKAAKVGVQNTLDGSQDNRDFPAALKLVRANAKGRFDETIGLDLHLNVDPRKANQIVRVMAKLPHGTGRLVRVAVFAEGPKAEEARKAGADIVGAHDLAESIKAGTINFDRCIATPDMMGIVGRVARILGPRQLMPNPKHGTVTMDVKTAVEDAKAGQVNFKVDRGGVLHCHFGKLSFSDEMLSRNLSVLMDAVVAAKPEAVKGLYVQGAAFSSTMGPGFRSAVGSLHSSLKKSS